MKKNINDEILEDAFNEYIQYHYRLLNQLLKLSE